MIGLAIAVILVGAGLTAANIRRHRKHQRLSDEGSTGTKQSPPNNDVIALATHIAETDFAKVSSTSIDNAFTSEEHALDNSVITQGGADAVKSKCLEQDSFHAAGPDEIFQSFQPSKRNHLGLKPTSTAGDPNRLRESINIQETILSSDEKEEPHQGFNVNTQAQPASSFLVNEKAESVTQVKREENEASNLEDLKSSPKQIEEVAANEASGNITHEESSSSVRVEKAPASLDRPIDIEPLIHVQIPVPNYQAPRLKGRSVRKVSKATPRNLRKEQPQGLPLIIKGRIEKGFWTFVLLASRPTGSPSEVEVRYGSRSVEMVEVGDDWYEVLYDDISSWFHGLVLVSEKAGTNNIQWTLTKRAIHILAPNNEVGSWTSTTRLVLGRKHLVACENEYVERVLAVLKDGGCDAVEVLDNNLGAPQGWTLLFPVTPSKSVLAVTGEDQMNTLRPLPSVEISLEGGIRLWNSTWMQDYPPTIWIRGDLPPGESVYVDETLSSISNEGAVMATSLNEVGEHHISIGGRQSSHYSIVRPHVSADVWASFEFRRGSICGGFVNFDRNIFSFLVTIPSVTPLLIGAEPGQIHLCPWQPGKTWTTLSPFEPVWAVPTNPLRCNKEHNKIIPLNLKSPGQLSEGRLKRTGSLFNWIQAIRNTSKKRLSIEGETPDAARLWRDYNVAARTLRRRYR